MWQFAILRFADHIFLNLRICDLRTQLFVADLKLPQISKYIIFLLTNISLKCFHSNLRTTLSFQDSLKQSYMAHRSIKYIYVSKKILEANQRGSGPETLPFSLRIFWIRDFRTGTPRKIADSRFAD